MTEVGDPERRTADILIGCADKVAAGCLIVAGLGIAAVAGLIFWIRWDEPRGQLPATVPIERIIESGSEPGLREGCVFALYAIDRRAASRIRSEGLAYLGGYPNPPKQHPRNPYSRWFPTPLDVDFDHRARIGGAASAEDLHALSATGCRPDRQSLYLNRRRAVLTSVYRALAAPGNYYAVTQNREGIIVVDTTHALAWFLYFG